MKNKLSIFLFALCPLVPATSRFAYGIIFSVAILLYYGAGLLLREMVRHVDDGPIGQVLVLSGLAGTAALFYGILGGVYPLLALSLELYIYLSAFSVVLLISISSTGSKQESFSPVIIFIPLLILFSLIREVLGLGTISLPVYSGFLELTVIPPDNPWITRIIGTGGGALILAGLFSFLIKRIFTEKGAVPRS